MWNLHRQTADLDGDGLIDLLDDGNGLPPEPYPESVGVLSVWYSKDLNAAWLARQALLP